MSYNFFASVALDTHLPKTLDYGVESSLETVLKRGMRVEVPLRGRLVLGTVVSIQKSSLARGIKALRSIVNPEPLLSEELFELALWISKYYATPLNKVFK